jgi:putative nucleotidyltransferase with HDIG domain
MSNTATTAADFVAQAKDLPVMPPIAAEVMKKAEDPESDLKSMANLISRDASLAVRVLKIANSSFYSMPRKIESIQQAIVLLGYTTLRSVVVAASVKDVFARYGLAERLLWEHAIAAGCAASVVAGHVGGFAKDEAFVGGLVHDVGKLVMHSEAEKLYQEVMRAVYADEQTSIQAERETFGFDHAEVGMLVLGKWGLPERLVAAVGGHHEIDKAGDTEGAKPMAALLDVADRMALHEGHGRRKPAPDLAIAGGPGGAILNLVDTDPEPLLVAYRAAYEREKGIFS